MGVTGSRQPTSAMHLNRPAVNSTRELSMTDSATLRSSSPTVPAMRGTTCQAQGFGVLVIYKASPPLLPKNVSPVGAVPLTKNERGVSVQRPRLKPNRGSGFRVSGFTVQGVTFKGKVHGVRCRGVGGCRGVRWGVGVSSGNFGDFCGEHPAAGSLPSCPKLLAGQLYRMTTHVLPLKCHV